MTVHILSGAINSGKTSWLLARWGEFRQRQSIPARALLAPGIWRQQQKVGFELYDSQSEQRWPLVNQVDGRFVPQEQGFQRALRLVEDSVEHYRLFILDEVGKFELQQRGHHLLLRHILSHHICDHLLLVVRETLVAEVVTAYDLANCRHHRFDALPSQRLEDYLE